MASDPLPRAEREKLIIAATHRGKSYDAAAALPDEDLTLLAAMPARRVVLHDEIDLQGWRTRIENFSRKPWDKAR